ncbi:MAG: dual specificity protein phosphatase family protein [Anaerolineae bacterium]|nr:dual specificity protein phosphatase family protein [Anaerolineae bacterium]
MMVNWITDQVALAGGAITSVSWPEIQRTTGIAAVVNLRAEQEDRFSAPMPLAYLWLPVKDHTDPTIAQLMMAAQFTDMAVKAGHKVLIHCMMGLGRSRTAASAYLIFTGFSVDDALPDRGGHAGTGLQTGTPRSAGAIRGVDPGVETRLTPLACAGPRHSRFTHIE